MNTCPYSMELDIGHIPCGFLFFLFLTEMVEVRFCFNVLYIVQLFGLDPESNYF